MLGLYKIQSPLGAGSTGKVYRACDACLDRTIAVKIWVWCLSFNPEATQRFDPEVHTVSRLSHPNICHVHEVGTLDGTSYVDQLPRHG